jgi:uncharacterized protein YrzB (UPF0473 family)
MKDNRMIIIDEEGVETEVEILLTFTDDTTGKNYVLFADPQDDTSVYAYTYTEDGDLDEVTDEGEWEMCAEVLGAFNGEVNDGEEA